MCLQLCFLGYARKCYSIQIGNLLRHFEAVTIDFYVFTATTIPISVYTRVWLHQRLVSEAPWQNRW